jgi:hypothetical protein
MTITLSLFGNDRSLGAAAQLLSDMAIAASNALPKDAHPTARVAWQYFSYIALVASVGLMSYGCTWGALSLLLDGRVSPILIGLGGGIALWKVIGRLEPIILKLLGSVPNYAPYNAMYRVNCKESEFYEVPPFLDLTIRNLNEVANKPSPPLKSAFEVNVDELQNCGGLASEQFHEPMRRFLVQARCMIALNYVRDLMFGPELTIMDGQRIERVQERVKMALTTAAKFNQGVLTDREQKATTEQKVLKIWAENSNYLTVLNRSAAKVREEIRNGNMSESITALNLLIWGTTSKYVQNPAN